MTTLHELVQSLNAKRIGATWMARCPAHDDRNPSLALREKNGSILVHCHAGCPQDAVIEALRGRGIWNQNTVEDSTKDLPPIVAEYLYRDEKGKVLYRVTRHEPKSFRAWRPDGSGGRRARMGDVRRVLYNLPEVVANPIVFVVEGEKDADTLRDHGFVATTNAFGAKQKWEASFYPFFAEKTVICVPDMDDPGISHMGEIARGLLMYAASVYWHEVEDAKDISDWFAGGHSEVEFLAQLEVMFAIA